MGSACCPSTTTSSAVLGTAQHSSPCGRDLRTSWVPALIIFLPNSRQAVAGQWRDGLCAVPAAVAVMCVHYTTRVSCAHIHTFCCVRVKSRVPSGTPAVFHCASHEAGLVWSLLCCVCVCDSHSSLSQPGLASTQHVLCPFCSSKRKHCAATALLLATVWRHKQHFPWLWCCWLNEVCLLHTAAGCVCYVCECSL